MRKIYFENIPVAFVSASQMKEIDRLAMEEYNIELIQMMENAGAALAMLTSKYLTNVKGKRIAVLAGNGNNGGGGLVAARRLSNWGGDVAVINLTGKRKDIPQLQMQIAKKLNIHFITLFDQSALDSIIKELLSSDIILDALIGYGLAGEPDGLMKAIIDAANDSQKDIISLDVPSGMDSNLGISNGTCIKAKATLTLALPKKGFLSIEARKYTGELYLADISIPLTIYHELGLDVQPFFNGQPYISLKIR